VTLREALLVRQYFLHARRLALLLIRHWCNRQQYLSPQILRGVASSKSCVRPMLPSIEFSTGTRIAGCPASTVEIPRRSTRTAATQHAAELLDRSLFAKSALSRDKQR